MDVSNVGDGIYVIRLTQFSDTTDRDFPAIMDALRFMGAKGIVLDLRDNPGGLVNSSLAVANELTPKGPVLIVAQGETERAIHNPLDRPLLPTVVLVNKGSASASEIVAGALKDYSRAILLGPKGQNTYGKGSVQTIEPLNVSLEKDKNGNYLRNAIRLTTAKYYTPSNIGPDGKSIHGIGIEPDVSVDLPEDHEVEMLRKGMLLGDPQMEPSKDEKEDKDSEKQNKMTEEEKKIEKPEPTATPKDEKTQDKEVDKPSSNDGQPFYLKKNAVENAPNTGDIQLRYGVDLLKALLIVRNEK